ncbi:glycosyltransferase [Ornithinimicrobium pekingense]|uniref:Glycosyltransferase 2-like domain-containing protein n=1 Tax=Ornithinimicrobium pekingense TaxID=384677 RepID=A0ABQ2F887_9MICO|nr:glycosyltransferase [Ornithinimicrobium pekingense]GGK67391.1 hypothetical protein GCM10011509_14650 [Ornithinimicrobium pekingense]
MSTYDRDLTIAYSSLAHRVPGIVAPTVDGVEILVCVQGLGEAGMPGLPVEVDRVVTVDGRGVARSRNAAIDAASCRYLLFCDDDVEVQIDDVLAAVAYLRRTGGAIALGRGMDPEGRLRKNYPSDRPVPLTLLNSAKAATYEMLVDVHQVRAAGVRFDERFGAGVDTYLGDEYLFIADLLRAGLRGDSLPFVYGVHPETSSGSRWGGEDLHVRAVVLNHVFGRLAPAARFVFALRRREEIGGVTSLARFVADSTTLAPDRARPGSVRQDGPVRRDSVA